MGKNDTTILFDVKRVRDGKSFCTRVVQAMQENRPIFTITLSFHREETGPDFSFPLEDMRAYLRFRLADVVFNGPKSVGFGGIGIPSPAELIAGGSEIETDASGSIETISIAQGEIWRMWWCRHTEKLPDDPALHRAVMAYMSDMGLVRTAYQPYEDEVDVIMSASMDHTLHYHREARADRWLLFHTETASSSHALGLVTGRVFTEDATLCASVLQEALVRTEEKYKPPPPSQAAAQELPHSKL